MALRILFRFDTPTSVGSWAAIDDRVMGGVSRSRLRFDPAGHVWFEGELSLAQGGGFASVRSQPGALGAPGAGVCVIEVLGDGKDYKLGLFTSDAFDGMSYQSAFSSAAGAWTTIRLPLAEFRPSFRGRPVPGAPALDPARLQQVGLIIAGRQAGRFALGVRSIGLA
jgi:hypothetical protein